MAVERHQNEHYGERRDVVLQANYPGTERQERKRAIRDARARARCLFNQKSELCKGRCCVAKAQSAVTKDGNY